ncbi:MULTISPECIES: hypothetical protein [unclassified Rhizobium]|uniref:hypothetical protein n=1 Tax=unclassified Rhizobium TaxID=2613769 RepID=UPI001FD96A2B|nr:MULTISPECIES: hypothetical protein [unclassified Rhizobium]
MAGEYRLYSEGKSWSIIDQATLEPARLDGVPLSSMEAEEARHMLIILKGIDRVRSASRKSASIAKRTRPARVTISPPPIVRDMFEMLRPLTVDYTRCPDEPEHIAKGNLNLEYENGEG